MAMDLIDCLLNMNLWVINVMNDINEGHEQNDCHMYNEYFAALQQAHIIIIIRCQMRPVVLSLYWNVETRAFMLSHDIRTLYGADKELQQGALQLYLSNTRLHCHQVVHQHQQEQQQQQPTTLLSILRTYFPNNRPWTLGQTGNYYRGMWQRVTEGAGPMWYWKIYAYYLDLWEGFYPCHPWGRGMNTNSRLTHYIKVTNATAVPHIILECDTTRF